MSDGNFEAIKYAYRQSKDGFVLSFVVHPNDMPDDMATAPIGTRFMIAYSAIQESGSHRAQPVGEGDGATREDAHGVRASVNGVASVSAPHSPKPNSTRAVMMAKDPEFWKYLASCGCKEPKDEHEAELDLKFLCNVSSKTELNDRPKAMEAFERLRRDFQSWRSSQRMGGR